MSTPQTVPSQSALYDVQKGLGAEFMEWGGWFWTLSFGDPEGEYRAVREGVGLVDGSPLRKWEFRGPDAARALDRLVTQDCLSMVDGQVHYTPMCNEDGTMVDDVTVWRFGGEHYRLIGMMDSDEEHSRRLVGDLDVEIAHVTPRISNVQLQGPASRDVALAAGADVSELPYFRFRTAEIGACPCVVSRTGYSGELGFEIFCEADDAARVWQALMDAGSAFGIRAYGMEAVDLLRTESALVIVEAEYTPGDHTPFEVNLGWAVKLDKPEFVGLEALREHARSNLARRLVGLDFGDADPPEDGTEVLHNGRPAGHASIVRRSPILGKTIGLAMLDTEAARSAEVDAGGARAKVVARLPFYDPDKRRPRA